MIARLERLDHLFAKMCDTPIPSPTIAMSTISLRIGRHAARQVELRHEFRSCRDGPVIGRVPQILVDFLGAPNGATLSQMDWLGRTAGQAVIAPAFAASAHEGRDLRPAKVADEGQGLRRLMCCLLCHTARSLVNVGYGKFRFLLYAAKDVFGVRRTLFAGERTVSGIDCIISI
jgi:hypothetical protein